MKIQRQFGTISAVVMAFALSGAVAQAQDAPPPARDAVTGSGQQATVEGLIIGRSGPEMVVKLDGTPRQTVILSDSTKATEKGGFLGWDRKDLGITALVPGLEVKVDGTYDPDHKLIAQKVVFSRTAMRTAKQIQAGINPTNEQVAAAQDQLRTDGKNIELAQQGIDANTKDIAQTRTDLDATTAATNANTEANAENKTAIGEANNRFGRMDSYEEKGNITVTFANGKAIVSPKDRDQLTDFIKTAADTPGYMIEVQGYASTTGSPALNQKLSAERADAVLAIIQQSGSVPLTRILAPAAMGISDQVGDNAKSRTGQAQNRRVVVTILVNKGING
jgi:OOP family OmpA-OmpF porin